MRRSRRMFFAGALALGIVALAGCHGGPARTYKIRFVSSTESKNVLELKLDGPNVLGRIHMAIFRSRIKGAYVLTKTDETTEGRVIQDPEGYTLISKDGKEQRFDVETEGSLKDESGTIWKQDNPTTTATVQKDLQSW